MITTSIDVPGVGFSYPCLMRKDLTNVVVLFSCKSTGTVVHSTSALLPVGCFKANWNMSEFKLFRGKIVITEDGKVWM